MDWLTADPIAHRGLHDARSGRLENSLSAAQAAVAAGFAIECDVQLSRDGEAVVFHDFTLDRLTNETGPVAERTASDLARIGLRGSTDRIPHFADLLAAVRGRVPIICEIKSAFDGDLRLADRVAALGRDYAGPLAFKSFDPAPIAHLRVAGLADRPLGIVSEASFDDEEWAFLDKTVKQRLAALAHLPETRPDFLSFHVNDLPHAAALLFRTTYGRPVMAWTVRTPDQRMLSESWADQMVFEGFVP